MKLSIEKIKGRKLMRIVAVAAGAIIMLLTMVGGAQNAVAEQAVEHGVPQVTIEVHE